jgi:ubiquinone/menaquinone biosynthesis C-methylase UbiE
MITVPSIINKTMDRHDLLTDQAVPIVTATNRLIRTMYSKGLYMTSWYGSLPEKNMPAPRDRNLWHVLKNRPERKNAIGVGIENRGSDYAALEDSADDARLPWYLFWEIFWVMLNGPGVARNLRLLDAGGISSLFTCYLASLGCQVHSIDINETLIPNANKIARVMGWRMFSYGMNMNDLHFENEYFDHAYSICVFEHLDYPIKQAALAEIARCLKPNGILSITFDYRNPAPYVIGYGTDARQENQLKSQEDIQRCFLANGYFELVGNKEFCDNAESYLVHPQRDNAAYTFGAIFLRKR